MWETINEATFMEVNIGLNVTGEENSQVERDGRAFFATEQLDGLFPECKFRRETSEYLTAKGEIVREDTLVAQVKVVDGKYQLLWLKELSDELGQDCIAVRFESGDGMLLGSKAEQYGSFNPEFFLRYNDVC